MATLISEQQWWKASKMQQAVQDWVRGPHLHEDTRLEALSGPLRVNHQVQVSTSTSKNKRVATPHHATKLSAGLVEARGFCQNLTLHYCPPIVPRLRAHHRLCRHRQPPDTLLEAAGLSASKKTSRWEIQRPRSWKRARACLRGRNWVSTGRGRGGTGCTNF